MNERGPKIRVVRAARDPYFRDLFANCVSSNSVMRLGAVQLPPPTEHQVCSNHQPANRWQTRAIVLVRATGGDFLKVRVSCAEDTFL
jgi:hypothetical protein